MRLSRVLRKTRAELRALLLPGELDDHLADAELHGPWWEERADYVAARSSQMTAAAAGHASTLAEHLIDWNPKPPDLWGWDAAEKILAALVAAQKR